MGVELQETRIRSASKEVVIGGMHRFCIIGERHQPDRPTHLPGADQGR